MALKDITRKSQELLNQNYRTPSILPGILPPGRGDTSTSSDPNFGVADEFIRTVPFIRADIDGEAFSRALQIQTTAPVQEPEFTARAGASTPWTAGKTNAFGEDLERSGTRFKKISTVVRTDELMNSDSNDDMIQVQSRLSKIAVVRALSEAVFHSDPPDDDDAMLAGLPFQLPQTSPQNVVYQSSRGIIGGLSEIEARCCPSDGEFGDRADVFVVSVRCRWRLLKELEDKGVTPQFEYFEPLGREVLHFHGIPVLCGRVPEPDDTPPLTDAWALKLYGPSGVRILHIGGESDSYGLRSQHKTMVTEMDANGEAQTTTIGVETFGVYSLLVPEEHSVARLTSIPAGDPFA